MRTVHKFPCPTPGGSETYKVSSGLIIHVGLDGRDDPCFWVEYETDFAHEPIEFFVVGTGWELPKDEPGRWPMHAGSWNDGPFIWHLYRWVNVYDAGVRNV